MKKGRTTGAKALVRTLEKRGTEIIFGYPGGANLPVYEALERSGIRHIQARHEQGAAHMADGYARATGKTGVCLATSGPGATNLVTGIATAYMDSSPVIAITGQVPRNMIGNDAFQEVDITGITIPITKHNYLIQSASQVAPTVEEAFYLADSGRRGPVLIDIPKDVMQEDFALESEKNGALEGYNPTVKGHPGQIKRAASIIKEAERPVIIAGGGVFLSDAFASLSAFVEAVQIPLVYTLMGKSALDNRHPLNLGLYGYHGGRPANTAVTEADIIIAIGTRFGDRSTGPLTGFAKNTKIVHIDVDPAEIGKNVPAYLPIVGDIDHILPKLTSLLSSDTPRSKWSERWVKVTEEEKSKKLRRGFSKDQENSPAFTTASITERAAEYFKEPVLVTDVGRHQIYAARYFPLASGRTFISSGGLGTMGFGLPAAIGASIGLPDAQVLLITGDGSFLMNNQEIVTAAESDVDVTVLVMNDSRLGMIEQLQDAFYGAGFDVSRFPGDIRFDRLAETFGGTGYRVHNFEELDTSLAAATKTRGIKVIDCKIEEETHVYPMVTGAHLLELAEGEA
ncbi:MAG: biosynthetic-type acetolactate synthase large subunit [Spirochaetaceae bacterium]